MPFGSYKVGNKVVIKQRHGVSCSDNQRWQHASFLLQMEFTYIMQCHQSAKMVRRE